MPKKNAWTSAATPSGRVGGGGGGGSSKGYKAPAYAATGNSRIRSDNSSRVQDRRSIDEKIMQRGNQAMWGRGAPIPPAEPNAVRDPDAPKPKPHGPTPPAYGIMPDRAGSLGPSTPKMGASGLNGSYGANTAGSPARRVGSGSW